MKGINKHRMEKVNTRVAVVALVVLLGLLLAGQEADAMTPTPMSRSYSSLNRNREKEHANRPPDQANPYTRGCSKIHRCRP